MAKSKATGHHGSWFALVDGEKLPCVHKHWWAGQRYNDSQVRPGSPKSDELVAAILEKKRVVLTSDDPYAADRGTGFIRTGYIAEYAVDDVEFDSAGLRFRFVARLKDLQ